jgi:dihydroflavonol-4-reductase
MAKVLVTGANGFLGSWVVRRLVHEGHQVKILARPTSDLSELAGLDFEIARGDVTDLSSLRAAFAGMETVFHLAGLIAYKHAERGRMEQVNVGGTRHVLEALRGSGVSRLVHLSSVVAVGAGFSPREILNEESTYNVSHLDLGYFETKHQAEILVREAVGRGEVDAVMLNPSTIYGPGDARKGSRKTQLKVARGQFPFYTKGGVNIIAVEDCLDGIFSAWKKGRTGERYILAGENITIKTLFEMIARSAGVPAPHLRLPSGVVFGMGWWGDRLTAIGKNGGYSVENAWTSQLYHWFDNSKAMRELDFNPRPAQTAVAASVAWMKEKGLA